MNREIKFRVWNGNKITYPKNFGFMGNSFGWSDNSYLDIGSIYSGPDAGYQPTDIFVLMQFAGILDKNGKEIYEGDIINFKSEYSDVFQITIMRFGPYLHKNQGGYDHIKCLGFYLECPSTLESCFVDDDLFDSDLEIIGNIYENPELLK